MKKSTFLAVCGVILIGGLICLHLAAQPDTVMKHAPASPLDQKIKDYNERELLEMKVECYRNIAKYTDDSAAVGDPLRGKSSDVAEAYANLATAEIELYRFTGDRDKLLAAMDAKIEALTNKLRAVKNAYDLGTCTSTNLREAEIQLIDALLERKQMER